MITKALLCVLFITFCTVAESAPTSTTSTTPPWINPGLGGKLGNAGSVIFLGNKSMDAVHVYASNGIARAIQSMKFGEFSVSSGLGALIIKPPSVIEATLPKFQYQMQPPSQVWSRLFGGRLVADGEWMFKMDETKSMGKYRATISDTELMITSQLGRTNDAKPTIQSIDCKTNFSQLRVEINGQTNLTLVDSCDLMACQKARKFYEDAICNVVKKFVQDMISSQMTTFPTRINLMEQEKLDYSLLSNEPKVIKSGIWTGLEGKIQWRGQSFVPFNPATITLLNKQRVVSFGMADFTFNTLFHQAHSQSFKFSASDLLSKSPSIKSQLSLNCSSITSTTPKPSRRISPRGLHRSATPACLESLIETLTNEQYSSDQIGDLVYKTDKAPSVYILSERNGFFDGGNGNLEIYGPAKAQNGQRQLLARAGVQLIRGDFTPKWNGFNISASIKLTRLSITKPEMTGEWLSKFTQFAMPILTDMFNNFLNTFAQFPIPLLQGFKCTSTEFIISSRTMQVDCDIQTK